ncbi:multiple sugar transport system permease protein [Arthrobacter pigmenti]|uniref:Multiple sugar transport system permease protein n=2 Tax=Arthrobacter pigmenti TaxID=271432 RepID=A0A846RRD1_9MICC|nr:multiple sugar transport system permease protein [Arthrobacter pigmenti]
MAKDFQPTMTKTTTTTPPGSPAPPPRTSGRKKSKNGLKPLSFLLLALGAFVFLFPFYYMLIGSLQTEPDTSIAGAFPNFGNITGQNYVLINESINLFRGLINSGIFTGGVILCTVIFGIPVGYALAQMHFRGRGVVFALMLLVQMVPFQLLLIPLYVLIVRDYGLADTYLGMILPFAINSTAVFVFRQYFLQLPASLFEAARIDGASEMRILTRIAVPLVRPAIVTAILLTFIGPWNEFLWPFLVTKDAAYQPLAVSLANYISNVAATAANPFGAILAGACVLAAPAVGLFIIFQRQFISTNIGSSAKG